MHDLPAILGLFASSFLLAFSGALTPGPLLTVTISEAIGKGARAGPLIIAGHGIAELALISAVAAGFGRLLSLDAVIGSIGLAGGLVLLVMGLAMARTAAPAAEKAISALRAVDRGNRLVPPGLGLLRCILLGGVVSVSNPYWTLWWVTIGLSLLTRALQISVIAIGVFYLGHILADLAWFWAVAFAVTRGHFWMNLRTYRIILLICGILLAGTGLYFAISGLSTLAPG